MFHVSENKSPIWCSSLKNPKKTCMYCCSQSIFFIVLLTSDETFLGLVMFLGLVVQSLTNLLRDQFFKCFRTYYQIHYIVFIEKMREAFAKVSYIFLIKIMAYFRYKRLKL